MRSNIRSGELLDRLLLAGISANRGLRGTKCARKFPIQRVYRRNQQDVGVFIAGEAHMRLPDGNK
jgi:hypothetical protein